MSRELQLSDQKQSYISLFEISDSDLPIDYNTWFWSFKRRRPNQFQI